jgi:hypothetical protein
VWLFLLGVLGGACNLNPRPGTPDFSDGKSNEGTGGSAGVPVGSGGSPSSPAPNGQDAGTAPIVDVSTEAGTDAGSTDAGRAEASAEAATN